MRVCVVDSKRLSTLRVSQLLNLKPYVKVQFFSNLEPKFIISMSVFGEVTINRTMTCGTFRPNVITLWRILSCEGIPSPQISTYVTTMSVWIHSCVNVGLWGPQLIKQPEWHGFADNMGENAGLALNCLTSGRPPHCLFELLRVTLILKSHTNCNASQEFGSF